jgi:hypothetical protein
MKYWAYVNNEVLGPYEKDEIKALPAYSPSLLICPQTPVGEKTEEWREVSSYPEFSESTVIDSPVISEQIPDQIETGSLQIDHNFSMSNSGRLKSTRIGQLQPLDQISPSSSGIHSIPTNKLERSGRIKISDTWNLSALEQQEATNPTQQAESTPVAESEAAAPEAAQSPVQDAFKDLYNIGNDAPAAAPETNAATPSIEPSLTIEPMGGMADPAPVAKQPLGAMPMQNTQEFSLGDPKTPAPAVQPVFQQPASTAAPIIQPQQQTAFLEAERAEIEGLKQQLNNISQNTVTKEDFTMSVDPIKMKLDQFDDMFASIRNNQNQQQEDLMSKLNSLENALSSLTSNMGHVQQNNFEPMPQQSMGTFESVSLTPADSMKGYENSASLTPADPSESLKKEKKKKKEVIQDSGAKAESTNIIVRFFKWIFKLIITLILLIALLVAAAIGLKKYDVYNVSPILVSLVNQYIPQYKNTIVPMLLEENDWKAGNTDTSKDGEQAGEPKAEEVPGTDAGAMLTPEQEASALSAVKEFRKAENGPMLEEKLKDIPGYKDEGWKVNPGESDGIYEATLSILEPEAKSYSFVYNEAAKTVSGKDEESQKLIDSLDVSAAVPAKKRRGRKGKKAASEAASAEAAKPAAAADTQKDGEFLVQMDE